MSKNTVQQAPSSFGKNNPPDMLEEEVIVPSFLLNPLPISTIPKPPAQSVKVNPLIIKPPPPFPSLFMSSLSGWTGLLPLQARGRNDAVFLTR